MRDQDPKADPIYQSSLRELKWILVIFLIAILWVVGYSRLFGYHSEDRPLATTLGMPSWVFWGVFVPWILATVVSSWFALTRMADHPLEDSSLGDSASGENSDG